MLEMRQGLIIGQKLETSVGNGTAVGTGTGVGNGTDAGNGTWGVNGTFMLKMGHVTEM